MFGGAKGFKTPQKSEQLDELGIAFQFKTFLASSDGGKIVKPLYTPNGLKNNSHLFPVYLYVYVNRFVFNKENDTMRGKSDLEQWLYMFKYGKVESFFPESLKIAANQLDYLMMSSEERAEYNEYMIKRGKDEEDFRREQEIAEQEKERAEQAEKKVEQVKERAEQAEKKVEQVKERAEQAEKKVEQVKREAEAKIMQEREEAEAKIMQEREEAEAKIMQEREEAEAKVVHRTIIALHSAGMLLMK